MNWTCRFFAVALAVAAFVSVDLHAQSTAATELNLGVKALKQSAYAEATQHLEKAVSLDPENQDARLYLASAYAKQFKPGIDTLENNHLAEQAVEQYQHVLDSNSDQTARIESAKGIADLYFQENKFDDSKKFYQMASDLDPKDPEPYFAIGRIDWIECMHRDIEEGAKLGLQPGEHPNPLKNPDQKKACDELKAKNTPAIREGIDSLNKAMKLRPNDLGAIEIMIDMYIVKANMECDNLPAREEDQKALAAWMGKRDFGISVNAKESSAASFSGPSQRQLFAGCQMGSGESSGSGEPYDLAEAYEVYSAIIPTEVPDPKTHTWLIRIDTSRIGDGSSRPTEPLDGAREVDSALDDYFKMNARTWLLQRNFTLPKPYKLVTRDEIKAMFPHPREFGEPWIELSAVGLNDDRTMAVVYMTSHNSGQGKSFVLQKHHGNQGNYLSVERNDFSSLVITDTRGLEVLNVNYLNPKAITITGTLRAPSGRSLTLDKMLRGTFCFGIPKGASVGSVFDI